MKLQTYVDIGPGALPRIAIANMSINASSFLPRSTSPDINLPQFIMVFILQRPLVGSNNITTDPNGEPVINLTRGEDPDEKQMTRMKELTASTMNSLKSSAGLRFVNFDKEGAKVKAVTQPGKLDLGGVAHELGTLPMYTGKNRPTAPMRIFSSCPSYAKESTFAIFRASLIHLSQILPLLWPLLPFDPRVPTPSSFRRYREDSS